MKKSINLIRILGLTGFIFAYLPNLAYANDAVTALKGRMESIVVVENVAADTATAEGRVIRILNYLIGFSGLGSVVALVWGGVQYIMSAGDEGKLEKATKTITNALIGLAIVILSGLIINFVLGLVINPPAS